jgi:dolichyl-phosphate beta-glucosyltransferase
MRLKSSSQPRVVVVIPCFNEEHRFSVDYFRQCLEILEDSHFLFINDGSKDQTHDVIQEFVSKSESCTLLNLKSNLGKANALRTGILCAAKEFQHAEVFVTIDADSSFSPTDLVGIISFAYTAGSDLDGFMVFSNKRHLEKSVFTSARTLMSIVIARALAFGYPIDQGVETQVGLKVFKNNSILIESLAQPFSTKWFFEWELILRIDLGEYPIVNFPLTSMKRIKDSKIKLASYLGILNEIFQIKLFQFAKIRSQHLSDKS